MNPICQICNIELDGSATEARDNFCDECRPIYDAAMEDFDPTRSLAHHELWIDINSGAAQAWRRRAQRA